MVIRGQPELLNYGGREFVGARSEDTGSAYLEIVHGANFRAALLPPAAERFVELHDGEQLVAAKLREG